MTHIVKTGSHTISTEGHPSFAMATANQLSSSSIEEAEGAKPLLPKTEFITCGSNDHSNESSITRVQNQIHDPLHTQWTEFLTTQSWQWFVTFTFKEEIHPEAADKLYRVWINKLNLSIYGKKWGKRPPYGVKHVRALEWQKRGVLHYHSLIANVGFEERKRWAHVCSELGKDSKAGFIQIDQYDEGKGGAESYLSKYVTKGGQVDISANFNSNPWTEQDPTNATDKRQKQAG